MSYRFLELFWLGLDRFVNDFSANEFDFSRDAEQIERDLNQMIERRIHKVMTGDEPFYVQHEPYEFETRKTRSSKPPEYDIAFILHENERLMFPFEAKLLVTDMNISKYVDDIKNSYLNCTYAPFSYEGAMLGYLLSGSINIAFESIATALGKKLNDHPDFATRHQKYSDHSRTIPTEKEELYPEEFRCHHLLLEFGSLGHTAT